MMKWIYNSYSAGLTDTEVAAASLREYGIRTAEKAGFLGLDLALFSHEGPKSNDPRIAKLGDRFKLLQVGRVTPDKHFDELFAALDVVEARRPGKVAIMVIGACRWLYFLLICYYQSMFIYFNFLSLLL